MLKLIKVSKAYMLKSGEKYQVLKDVNLDLNRSEFIAVIGRSGSGKTTLLNILGGLDIIDQGSFFIDDIDTRSFTEKDWDRYRNQNIGFIFQQFNLIQHLTVYENVEVALILNGFNKKERKTKVLGVLNKVGLEKHIDKKPGFLSGGEQQRVVIARAIVNNPDIILADEPTGQLDSKTAKQILDLIKSVGEEKLVILVTHMDKLISSYATRIIRIENGVIESRGGHPALENNYPCGTVKKRVKFRELNYLSIQNIKRKISSSIILIMIYSMILGLILSLISFSQKNVQNDIYHVLASDIPMNLVQIAKSNNDSFTLDEMNDINQIDNIQSVVPVFNQNITLTVSNQFMPIDYYEFLPTNLNQFYLKDALVCGSYPDELDEVLLNIKTAINIVDDNNTLYSRYDQELISDNDIWKLIRDKQITLTNLYNETYVYNISGIVNDTSWNYSDVDIYFHEKATNNVVGENATIQELKIYLLKIDETSRRESIDAITSRSNYYLFNQDNIFDVNHTYHRFNQLIEFINTISFVLILISLVSTFALINYNMNTRVKEVGILKSLGASSKNIKSIFTTEYLYLSIISVLFSYFITILFINILVHLSHQLYFTSKITLQDNFLYPKFILFLSVSSAGVLLMYLCSFLPIQNISKKNAVDILKRK